MIYTINSVVNIMYAISFFPFVLLKHKFFYCQYLNFLTFIKKKNEILSTIIQILINKNYLF